MSDQYKPATNYLDNLLVTVGGAITAFAIAWRVLLLMGAIR